MPLFLAALLGGLVNIAATLAGRVFIALGLSVFTVTGIDTTIGWLIDKALNALTGLPSELVGLMAYVGIGQCLSIISSAFIARMLLDGLSGGALKKWVIK